MAKISERRAAILDRVIGHLYYRAQCAHDRAEHELWEITLRLVGIARRGDEPTLDQASYYAVGRNFEGWRRGTAERLAMMACELAACIPDYDPQEARHARLVEKSPVRGSEPFTGNLYAFEKPRPAGSAQPEPVCRLPAPSARDGTG